MVYFYFEVAPTPANGHRPFSLVTLRSFSGQELALFPFVAGLSHGLFLLQNLGLDARPWFRPKVPKNDSRLCLLLKRVQFFELYPFQDNSPYSTGHYQLQVNRA